MRWTQVQVSFAQVARLGAKNVGKLLFMTPGQQCD